jgi:hypothetical protein
LIPNEVVDFGDDVSLSEVEGERLVVRRSDRIDSEGLAGGAALMRHGGGLVRSFGRERLGLTSTALRRPFMHACMLWWVAVGDFGASGWCR